MQVSEHTVSENALSSTALPPETSFHHYNLPIRKSGQSMHNQQLQSSMSHCSPQEVHMGTYPPNRRDTRPLLHPDHQQLCEQQYMSQPVQANMSLNMLDMRAFTQEQSQSVQHTTLPQSNTTQTSSDDGPIPYWRAPSVQTQQQQQYKSCLDLAFNDFVCNPTHSSLQDRQERCSTLQDRSSYNIYPVFHTPPSYSTPSDHIKHDPYTYLPPTSPPPSQPNPIVVSVERNSNNTLSPSLIDSSPKFYPPANPPIYPNPEMDLRQNKIDERNEKCEYHNCPNRARVAQIYGKFCNRHVIVAPCGFPGCRDKAMERHSMCEKHLVLGKDALHRVLANRAQNVPICKTLGCFKNDQGRGHCRGHEKLLMATGRLPKHINKRRLNSAYTMCSYPQCHKHSQRNHLCRSHGNLIYKQAQELAQRSKQESFDQVLSRLQNEVRRCTHANCTKNSQRDRLCTMHYYEKVNELKERAHTRRKKSDSEDFSLL